ncbi:hypothetical protein [Microlunatus aurantiacus]|uniref:hypothetical protein n=1 Tax=Microlunatus aurantiacus TaxID=446786 RepID=UPI0031D7CAE4
MLVVGMVLTLGLTAYLFTQAPPRYQATANLILLLPPNARGAEGAGSPYLYLPTGLQTLARIVVSGTESLEFRRQLVSEGFTSQYELGVDVGTPVITVSVEGLDPENVMATRDEVIQGLEDELKVVQREENTPTRQTAHARIYGIQSVPDQLEGNRARGLLMALATGGLITLLAAFAADRAMALHADRRRRGGTPGRAMTADDGFADDNEDAGGWGWSGEAGADSEADPDTPEDEETAQPGADDIESRGSQTEAVPPPSYDIEDGQPSEDEDPRAGDDDKNDVSAPHTTSERSDEQATQYQRV